MGRRHLSRSGHLVRLALLFPAALALVASLVPSAFALEAGGLELTSPVKQNLKRLQDRWQDWLTAYLEEDPEKAAEALDKLMETVESLGMERLPDLSVTAAALAVRSAEEGKGDRAVWSLEAARRLDPERPETEFAAAGVERIAGNYPGMVTHTIEGYVNLLKMPLMSRIWKQNLGVWTIYVLLLTSGFYLLSLMAAHGSRLFYDLGRLVSPPLPAGTAEAVAVLILIWPIFLPSGLMWLGIYWSVLLWGYGSRSIRGVLIFLWIVTGTVPLMAAHQEREVRMSLLPATRAVENLRAERLYGALFLDLDVLQNRAGESPVVTEVMADLHRSFGQWEHARLIYNSLIGDDITNPTAAPALNNLGVYYYLKQDYGTAIRNFKEASAADPTLAEPYYNVSAAHGRLFDFPAQHDALATAKNLDPARVTEWERVASSDGGAEIVAIDGGLRRADEVLAVLADGSGDESPSSAAWQGYVSLVVAVLAAVFAVTLHVIRESKGYPSEKLVRGSASGNPWIAALIPGWASIVDGEGVKALLGIFLPMTFTVASVVAIWSYRLPLGFNPSRSLTLTICGAALVVIFLVRLVVGRR